MQYIRIQLSICHRPPPHILRVLLAAIAVCLWSEKERDSGLKCHRSIHTANGRSIDVFNFLPSSDLRRFHFLAERRIEYTKDKHIQAGQRFLRPEITPFHNVKPVGVSCRLINQDFLIPSLFLFYYEISTNRMSRPCHGQGLGWNWSGQIPRLRN